MGRNDNQSALLRQWELIKLIPSHGEGITVAEMTLKLQERGFQIAERQVLRDLGRVAEAFPIEIIDDNKRLLWKWVQGASIDFPGLTVTDALSLQLVEESLKPLLPVSLLNGLETRFRQAEKQLALLSKDNRKARWASKVRSVSPTLPLITPAIDSKILETVQDALLADLQVDVEYINRDKKIKPLRLHPLAMVCRGAVTYLVATAKEYEETRLFAVHRIRQATRTLEPVKRPANFDLDEYIQSGGLQFGNGRNLHLTAWIDQDLANILEETPLAKDQKIIPEDGLYKLSATVADSWQFSWWIMSWGGSIEVIAPVSYRRKIASRLKNAAAQYEDAED